MAKLRCRTNDPKLSGFTRVGRQHLAGKTNFNKFTLRMSHSKHSSSRRKKSKISRSVDNLTKGLGVSLPRILLGLALLIGLILLLYFVIFEPNEKSQTVEEATPTVEDSAREQVEIDIAIARLRTHNRNQLEQGDLFAQLTVMEERLKMSSEIVAKYELNAEQNDRLTYAVQQSAAFIVLKSMDHEIDCEARKRALVKQCEKWRESPNAEISDGAHWVLNCVASLEMSQKNTEDSYQVAKQRLTDAASRFKPSLSLSQRFFRFVEGTRQPDSKALSKKLQKDLADILIDSSQAEIRSLGSNIKDHVQFWPYDLRTLPQKIGNGNPSGKMELDKAIEILESYSEANIRSYRSLLGAAEGLLAVGQVEESSQRVAKISRVVESIEISPKKRRLTSFIQNQKARLDRIGKPFDVDGKLVNGEPITLDPTLHKLIVFCDRKSLVIIKSLVQSFIKSNGSYNLIFVFVDPMNNRDLVGLDKLPPGMFLVDAETGFKFQNDFPVDFFPYAILLDKSGNLEVANIRMAQVENLIGEKTNSAN